MTDDDQIVEIGARAQFNFDAHRRYGDQAPSWWEHLTFRDRNAAREEFKAALSALRSAGYVVEQGWQPIETAPRDGTWILLFLPDNDSGPETIIEAQWAGLSSFWAEAFSDAWIEPNAPTAWRPLPTPPDPQ